MKKDALKEVTFVEGIELVVVMEASLGYIVGGDLEEICKLTGIGRAKRGGVGIYGWCGDESEVSMLANTKGGYN